MRYHRWIVLPLLLLTAGCIPLFYAYPSISYVPGINCGPDHKGAVVFRVDATEETPGPGHYQLHNIPMTQRGMVSGQARTSFDEGYYWNCISKVYASETSHTLHLRVYRPGYELIDIHAWQNGAGIQWKEARKPKDSEHAIDQLLANVAGEDVNGKEGPQFAHLEPGSVSETHHEALLFAAGEYDRLAEKMEEFQQGTPRAIARCRAKAQALRDLADR